MSNNRNGQRGGHHQQVGFLTFSPNAFSPKNVLKVIRPGGVWMHCLPVTEKTDIGSMALEVD